MPSFALVAVGLTADTLKKFFNAALVTAKLTDTSIDGEPIIDATLGIAPPPEPLSRRHGCCAVY